MLSYKCTAACRHCMYACSQKWKSDWISEEDLAIALTELGKSIIPSPWGADTINLNHGLHFTGGEPFLNFQLLLKAAQMAEEMNIPSTFVETNGFWCRDDQGTKEKLSALKQAGVKGILISANPFYAEYVPFERTERCIEVSLEVFGNNVMVYQEEFYHRFRKLGIKDKIFYEDYLALSEAQQLPERVELFLMGRAASRLKSFYPAYPARTFFKEPCRPSFLRDWHNHFDNYGNVVAGYCGGISLGHWKDLQNLIVDFERQPVLKYLIEEDMEGLFKFATEHGFQESDDGYVSNCHLCLDIRRHLVKNGEFPELSPKAFYENLE